MTVICEECENAPVEVGATTTQLEAAVALATPRADGGAPTVYLGAQQWGLLPVRVYDADRHPSWITVLLDRDGKEVHRS